jgi:transposase InsO family protein
MSDLTMNTAYTAPPPPPSTAAAPIKINNGIKLDRCPELKGSENYEIWSQRMEMIFEVMGIDEFVIHGIPAHDDPSAANLRVQANMVYLQVLSDNVLNSVLRIKGAHAKWEHLKQTYQRKSVSCLVSTSLKFMEVVTSQQTKDPAAYIVLFEEAFTHYEQASNGGPQNNYRQYIQQALNQDDYKRDMLLAGFEKTHPLVVDNLKTKNSLTYSEAKDWLLNLTVQQANRALPIAAAASSSSSGPSTGQKHCSWCGKHSPTTASGHDYRGCSKLKEHKKQQKAITAPATTNSTAATTQAAPPPVAIPPAEPNHSAAIARNSRVSTLSNQWIFDTGATSHMCSNADLFSSLRPDTGSVSLADQSTVGVTGIGTVIIYCIANGIVTTITLHDVLLVPDLGRSLFSWRAAKRKNSCYLIDNGTLELRMKSDDSTFLQTRDVDQNFIVNTCDNSANLATYQYWHGALGHPSVTSLRPNLYQDGNLIPTVPKDFECHTCRISKSKHRVPRPIGFRAKERFDLVHSDICGPFPHPDLDGNRYFLTVIDDQTRFSKVYFLKEKSQAAQTLIGFIRYVQTQFGKTIKALKTDQGGEYISNTLTDFLTENGIEHIFSPAYLHESNGTAERYNQTLCTIARAGMTVFPNHPHLWSEAIYYACFTKNRLPHSALQGETPFFIFWNEQPEIKNLRPFGSSCYTHIPTETRAPGKLLPRALEGRFVGYSRSDKIYRIYVPDEDRVYESRDIIFPGQHSPSILRNHRSVSPSQASSDIENPFGAPSNTPSTYSSPSSTGYKLPETRGPVESQSITIPLSEYTSPSPPPTHLNSNSSTTPSEALNQPHDHQEFPDPNDIVPAIPNDLHHGFSDDSSVDEFDSASIHPQYRSHPIQPAERRRRPVIQPALPTSRQVTRPNARVPPPTGMTRPIRSAISAPSLVPTDHQIDSAPAHSPAPTHRQIEPAPTPSRTETSVALPGPSETPLPRKIGPKSETLISYSEHVTPSGPRVTFNDTVHYREPSSIVSSSNSSNDTEAPLPINHTTRFGRTVQPPRNWWEVNHPRPAQNSDDQSMADGSERDARSDLTMANAHLAEISEPQFFRQATMGPDSDKWTDAIDNEMSALNRNETWDIVDKPSDRKVIGSKWVFKIKYDSTGNIEKYKARLVAKGFSQIEGLDYDELFAPVVRFDSLRLLLALAAKHKWTPAQMDVTAAFLYPELKDDLYMQLPEGFRQDGKVAKLKKCIYGLKQSPREWYSRLTSSLNRLGFFSAKFDPCVFIHKTQSFYIAVYVDDLSLFGPAGSLMTQVKQTLSSEFDMKDLGTLHWLLGLEINFTDTGISITQTAYFEKILKRFQLNECNPCALPIDPNIKFNEAPTVPPDTIRTYQSIIGSLMYAVSATRPDLCFAVSFLSQFNHSPTTQHLQAAKRVLRYLNGTKTSGLFYPYQQSLNLVTYSDADYANCPITRKSISGNIVQLSSATISWRSKKQKSVSTSTAEAEYQALSLAAKQTIWTHNALNELTISPIPTPIVYCDNKAAIDIANNPKISDRSKHIDVHFHFVRENVEQGTFFLMPVATAENLADTCTKGLPGFTFQNFRKQLLGSN